MQQPAHVFPVVVFTMKKYARIFSYLKPFPQRLAGYFVAILLSTVFSIVSIGMLMPFMELIFTGKSAAADIASQSSGGDVIGWIREQMNAYAARHPDNPMSLLWLICGLMMLSIILKNFFLYLSFYILTPLKNGIVTRLRAELYQKVLQLPIGYFTEKRKGDLMSRITNDITEVENSVVGTLEGWVRDPIQIILNLAVLIVISPQLTLFLFLLLPVLGFIIGRISRSLKKQSMAAAELQGQAVSVLDETLGGLRVIKAFNAEGILGGRFSNLNNLLFRTKNAIAFRRDLASPMSETLGIFMFCCILLFGGWLVITKHTLEGAAFLTYLGLFYNIINPAKNLSQSFYNMQKGSAAIQRIEEVLDTPVVIQNPANPKTLEKFNDSISFKGVNFSYGDVQILRDINLHIPKGKTLALVGSSGSGKSTLADLIPRFHDVSSGSVMIDGVDIREYDLPSVRSHMGIVTQEPILFNDSIANNIALGYAHGDASEEKLKQAAQIANADKFIHNKEEGFAFNVGDRGTRLSGGERQRLTIARAVMKNPPILILDEATSSLDTESEKLVQDAINNVMHNRTTIVIAHRLSTIRHADEIIVLDKGSIVERGNHETLMQKGGFYRRLVDMQEFH